MKNRTTMGIYLGPEFINRSDAIDLIAPEPVPLMATDITQETTEGPKLDRVMLWHNAEGLRCRLCPIRQCTFQPGPEGQGICVVRRDDAQPRLRLCPEG